MSLAVNVLSRNPNEDRVIPRFARYLRDLLGWTLTARPTPGADVFYLSGYFENGLIRSTPGAAKKPVAAYFTHLEEQPANNAKARLFHQVAEAVDLRIVTCKIYADLLAPYGPTVQIPPAVERDRFVIPASRGKPGSRPLVAGFSGFTYTNGRKGEKLANLLVRAHQDIPWRAAGRGWPVPTQNYPWHALPAFYQSLDILVCTATVEGVPMPPLEALACGVSVVIPRGVGLLDELGEAVGVHRYEKGNPEDLARAFDEACQSRKDVEPRALRGLTEPYTVEAWCLGHQAAFEKYFISGITYPTREESFNRLSPPVSAPPPVQISGTDDEILAHIREKWHEVDTVLSWTRKKIPYLKRQIAPYQGALLAYYAHGYDRPGAGVGDNPMFLEIGTAIGYSACLMATAAPRARITTLNPKDGEFEQAVKNLRIRSNVRVVKETSQAFFKTLTQPLTPGPSPRAERGGYDLIFVDGDHAYNMVLHDAQFFNCLKPGGLILFHDYSPDGSARPSDGSFRALNELAERHRPFDVLVIGTGGVGMAGWIRQEGETWT